MNSNELHALLLDTNARIQALEASFIGYVATNESVPVSCEVALTYYKFHIEILHELLQQLPSVPLQSKVERLLHQKIDDSHRSIEYYETRQRMAEELGNPFDTH